MPSYINLSDGADQPSDSFLLSFPWGQDWLELAPDLSDADWVVAGIRNCLNKNKRTGHNRAYIPDEFDAYVRLLHPAYGINEAHEHTPLRWAEIAAWNGWTVHPWIDFRRIANIEEWDPRGYEEWGHPPREGSLPPAECQVLYEVVQEFTGSPCRHYFCFWDGYGQEDFIPALRGWPKIRIDIGVETRNYFLFRGRLDSGIVEQAFWLQSPNIWWSADRAWCIVTDVDAMETWIGGSAACVERVLNHPQLEAFPITLDARPDSGGDAINPRLAGA